MNKILLTFFIAIHILGMSSCDDGNSGDTEPVPDNFTGIWSNKAESAITMGIQNISGQPENRMIICDFSENGEGCLPGTMLDENTFRLDEAQFGTFNIETTGISINIVSDKNVDYSFTGLYNSTGSWPNESCGLTNVSNNQIGIVEEECIIGEWYTLLIDPFGGPSTTLNKNYYSNGTGIVSIPDENKTYTFSWIITNNLSGELLSEFNYSDTTLVDSEYTFECTGTGLALGGAESYIRLNTSCLL